MCGMKLLIHSQTSTCNHWSSESSEFIAYQHVAYIRGLMVASSNHSTDAKEL